MTRREAWVSALVVFVVALVVRAIIAPQIVFPKPEDTAYYVGVARNMLEGRGLVSDAIWSYVTEPLVFPKPAFEVWLPLPTFIAVVPMALLGHVVRGRPDPVRRHRRRSCPVLAWRLAADVALERGLSRERLHAVALGTGLTCAVYLPARVLLRPDRLDDGVRGPRPRRLPADGARRPRTARRPLVGLAGHRHRRPARARRADPQRGGLAGVRLGRRRVVRPSDTTRAERVRLVVDRRRRRAGGVRAVGVPQLGRVRQPAARARPSPTRSRSPATTSSPGTTRRPSSATSPWDRPAWSRCGSRACGTTSSRSSCCPGFPLSLLGVLALPWQGRDRATRPVVILAITTFLVTSLVFPVATTWGTFLHASGPIHVLIVLSALLAVDAGIARLGAPPRLDAARRLAGRAARRVLRPAVLAGPAAVVRRGLARDAGLLRGARCTDWRPSASRSARTPTRSSATSRSGSPRPAGCSTLGLPDEPPADVVDLAQTFGARLLVLSSPESEEWHGQPVTGPMSECFHLAAPAAVHGRGRGSAGRDDRVRDRLPMSAAERDVDLEAEEAERQWLAHEIHDGPAQTLANAIFQIEIIERLVASDPAQAAVELGALRDSLHRELGGLRGVISALRPSVLAELGLDGAIGESADRFAYVHRGRRLGGPDRPDRRPGRPDPDRHPAHRPGGPAECPQARRGFGGDAEDRSSR